MNPARASAEDSIPFLIGSPRVVSATEAARVQPVRPAAPAHDAFTRLLTRIEPDPATLWADVRTSIDPAAGVLVIDDSPLDTPRPKHLPPVGRHWSGNHHAVVRGINLITALWSDGDRLYPVDDRLYHKAGDGLTKHDHLAAMLQAARGRGFRPRAVRLGGRYASVETLKRVREAGWTFVTRFKANRSGRVGHGAAGAPGEQEVAAQEPWSGCRRTGRCGCFGWSPQTATRRTGRPTTWGWTRRGDWCSRNCRGRSRSTIGR